MIKNISRGKVLVRDVKFCNSILSKAKGLMFSKDIKDKGLIFTFKNEERWSLHMLFVFFLIDVLWLDEDKRVVDLKEHFRPFELLAKPAHKARYVIELPDKTITKTKTEVGDKILF